MNWPKYLELSESGKTEPGFHFRDNYICFKTPPNDDQLKKFTLAEKTQALSKGIKAPVSLHVSRHFHAKPISANLPPHEDPPSCKPRRISATGYWQQQQQDVLLNCDYLFTTVRKVDKESQTGHLCLYLAAKGLGNVDTNFKTISLPTVTDDVNDLVELGYLGKPVALRVCRIDNKPGAGYAINQNTEYVFDTESAQKNSSGNTGLICRNKENPCQVLFRGELSSSQAQSRHTRFINKGHNNEPTTYKILHGFEISLAPDLKPAFAGPTADDKENPDIKRDILIGRLAVAPQKEELPEFYEKKSTEYGLEKT